MGADAVDGIAGGEMTLRDDGGKGPRRMAYVHYDLARTFSIHNDTSHPLASLESMVLTFSFEEETLRILNVYHRVPQEPWSHNLLHILSVMILNPIPYFPPFSTHLFRALGHSFPTRSLTRRSDRHQIT